MKGVCVDFSWYRTDLGSVTFKYNKKINIQNEIFNLSTQREVCALNKLQLMHSYFDYNWGD